MIWQFTKYTEYLSWVMAERKARNPAYSLRSFARSLGLAPSTLSEVLSGRRNFSANMAVKVASSLKLKRRETRYFCTLVHYESASDLELKIQLMEQLRTLNPEYGQSFEIALDRFKLMSEWYHVAILEMTYLEPTLMSPVMIAHALGISPTQACDALELLLKLDLIAPAGPGRFRKTKNHFSVKSEFASAALRKFHRQMLTKAQESLIAQSPEDKVVGSETLPIHSQDLPEAREIIENCFQQLVSLSERTPIKNHVFHLGIQFFNLTSRNLPV